MEDKKFRTFVRVVLICFIVGFIYSLSFSFATYSLEKKVIEVSYILTNFKLYEAPLTKSEDSLIRENQNSLFFLNQKNWI